MRMKKNIKAVIFDLDGTIVTTEDAWEKAALSWLARQGISADRYAQHEQYLAEELLGVTPKEWSNAIKKTFQLSVSQDDLFDQIRTELFEVYGKDVTFIAGFESFYDRMCARKLPHAIATNSDDESLQSINQLMHLSNFFKHHIYNISMVPRGKPHPDLYLHAAYKLGMDPADCIAIEDSAIGIQAAKNAGIYCIGITTAGKPDLLRQADLVVDSYDEITL